MKFGNIWFVMHFVKENLQVADTFTNLAMYKIWSDTVGAQNLECCDQGARNC